MERRDYRIDVARPNLSTLFCAAVALWAGCAGAYSGSAEDLHANLPACLAVIALGVALAIATGFLRKTGLAVLAASLALGVLLGLSAGLDLERKSSEISAGMSVEARVTLLEDSAANGFGESALARLDVQGAPLTCRARFGAGNALYCGEAYTCKATLDPVDFSQDSRAWQSGCAAIAKVDSKLAPEAEGGPLGSIIGLRKTAIERIGGDTEAGALMQALCCGYRRSIREYEVYQDFQTCGLAHLIAVSGAHLVIVCGLFSALLKTLCASRKATVGMLACIMASYLVLSGFPVSAIRATVMTCIGLSSTFAKRRPSSLNALGACIFAMLLADPQASLSASFALSALSTAGIVIFCPLVKSWLDRTPIAHVPFASDALALTFSSSLLSQLYACSLFSFLPLASPLSNVLTAPLFPLCCAGSILAALSCALGIPFASAISACADILVHVLCSIVKIVAKLPFASVPFAIQTAPALAVTFVVAAMLWASWLAPRRAAALLACAVAAFAMYLAFPQTGDAIIMLDVGQGDSILIRSQGKTLLVDTGNQDAKLKAELARNRITHLDAVLITHADDDHCGSLDAIAQCASVGKVMLAQGMDGVDEAKAQGLVRLCTQTAGEVLYAAAGDSFSFGSFGAHVIWPHSLKENGGNADSLCILLEYDGDGDSVPDARALFTGDAESEQLAQMQEESHLGNLDILKVGHHGSRKSITAEQANSLKPKIALIGVGATNRYGHPTEEAISALVDSGASVYRTDRDGEVTCTLTPQKITVSTMP